MFDMICILEQAANLLEFREVSCLVYDRPIHYIAGQR